MQAPDATPTQGWIASDRVIPDAQTSATDGSIRCTPGRTIWLAGHALGGLAAVIFFPSWGGFAVCLGLSAITLCAGHSVGMHRLLIHRSFEAPRGVEWVLVWLGTLVGMAGPIGMIRAHDMRDWHQRQTVCPPHPSHAAIWWRDAWWQMCCEFRLTHPPRFVVEPRVKNDPVIQGLERTWMAQQIPVVLILWAFGGIGWVLWGVCLRVSVSLMGHWAVGHAAHHGGHQGWRIEGLPVQGYNLQGLGLLTFGEGFHGNHHAFPYSARLGVAPGQLDPGFWLIKVLEALGLAWGVQEPGDQPARAGLVRV